MRGKLTKGKLSKAIAFSTSGTTPPVPPSIPITPYKIFECSIDRSEHLVRIHEKAYGTASKPSDAHRAAIVLAVAALDAFIRTLVVENIRAKIADQKRPVPSKLREQAKELLGLDGLFDAARDGDLGSRLERGFRQRFEEKSFQGINNIEEALRLIGHDNVFHSIADSASVNEDHLKRDLGRFTKRRHIIAHCGDYDLTQTPPNENDITLDDAKECIKVVRLVAAEIHKLK
jgi:HEPN superfamily RiboL-PSP-like protein